MTANPIISPKGLRSNRESAAAFWMVDILWFVLVDGNDTGGAYSVMEQFMRCGSGAFVPHAIALTSGSTFSRVRWT
jgi:hypothetical protein